MFCLAVLGVATTGPKITSPSHLELASFVVSIFAAKDPRWHWES